MTQKIQKILSHFGYGSRRSIEKMINSGKILVNGKKAVIGQYLNEKNFGEIRIQDKIISIKKTKFRTKVLIYNKPEGEICTTKDFQKRPTVFDKLPFLNTNRWISIGRLDINTRGLLLFTNDGNLANQLMHPKNQIEREYYMRIFGKINKNTMNILKKGVRINNTYSSFKSIYSFSDKESGKNQWFKGILCEGKNREIRSMWKTVKCQVNRLIRIRYGNIVLPRDLKIGNWTELNSTLIDSLYNLISTQK
ncbi:pseudouridine synthase [Buchnera aphidicola]|uniref:pseudouridine synthase n=1 Tax=Buchnera aphidicola TaxID=9 RepID=UPI0003E3384E|nr:pseudouridine synthase [Buchnera aphidicola]AHG61825.1 Ycil [Buchnera aphidicola str. F009 (Myzus persicae)]